MADQEQPVGGAGTRQSVGSTLSQLGFATSRHFGQITGTLGLEPRHIALLRAVSKTDGQSQQAVAERLHIPARTMVALIDHLVQQEMLERRPHPSDRRARLLYLTAHGREVLSKAASFSAEWENYIQAGLWRGFAVRDGNLITGQQNFSGGEFARWSSTRSDDNSRWGVGGRW